jgi:orotidine-5'-phosphate decarboxylase
LSGAAVRGESPLVLALDTGDRRQALDWSLAAGEAAGMVKVGLELFGAEGPAAVAALAGQGRRVMLDLKLHDIPATVAGAVRMAERAGAELLTVHALGGPAMLAAAVEAADRCRIAAVTVLTSAGPADLAAAGLPPAEEAVPRLARLAVAAGCPALVCSPLEAAALRGLLGPEVELICPGVRPEATRGRPPGWARRGPAGGVRGTPPEGSGEPRRPGGPGGPRGGPPVGRDPVDRGSPGGKGPKGVPRWDGADDQARVATPAAAMRAGASRIVVGRPITRAPDVGAAARAVRDQALAAVP